MRGEQRELWLWLREGLCNRLRVLLSAIGYARETDRDLVVHWSTSPGGKVAAVVTGRSHKPFRAHFEDLFDAAATPRLRLVGRREWRAAVRSADVVGATFPPALDAPHRRLWLDTYEDFYSILPDPPAAYARELRVTDELQAWTDRVLDRFGGTPALGVHIRSIGAHDATLAYSPVEWFEGRIDELLEALPGGERVFLSTDDAAIAARLHARHPERLVESTAPPRYNSRRAIQKGMVDLLVLARSRHIVGSHYSSFSDMAFDLQGKLSYEDASGVRSRAGLEALQA